MSDGPCFGLRVQIRPGFSIIHLQSRLLKSRVTSPRGALQMEMGREKKRNELRTARLCFCSTTISRTPLTPPQRNSLLIKSVTLARHPAPTRLYLNFDVLKREKALICRRTYILFLSFKARLLFPHSKICLPYRNLFFRAISQRKPALVQHCRNAVQNKLREEKYFGRPFSFPFGISESFGRVTDPGGLFVYAHCNS